MLTLKNLARRKIRTVLTVLGVAIGVAVVVAVVSVARGFRTQFNDFFAAGDAHLVLTLRGAADPFISYLPDRLADELLEDEQVAAVHPFLFAAQQIPGRTFFFFYGVTPGSPVLAQVGTLEGRALFDDRAPAPGLYLGKTAAEHLDRKVGSTLELGSETFEVVGIFDTAVPLLASGGFLALADAQRVAGLEGKMSSALIHLRSFDQESIARAQRSLEARFPQVEATAPLEFTNAFDEFELLDQGVAALSILAVFIGGIGVMNTMLMSVFERTREIGILQAVGWSKAMILREVLLEGLLVCVMGGILGAALGVASVTAVGSLAELSWVSGDFLPSVFVQAMAVAVGMGLLGVTYPALRALRVAPIEALRYE